MCDSVWRKEDFELDEEAKCAKARPKRATTRGREVDWWLRGGEGTQLGKAPHAPSCPL